MDATGAERLVLTFFGGEPLLNLAVMYSLAEELWDASQARGMRMLINVITNGLLLTPEVIDRLQPFGLNGVKITLDGDRVTHDRMRPLRGGQGTFDRIIANLRRIAGRCQIAIGGNFDESSVASYPALLEYLASQDFAPQINRVTFKPIIRGSHAPYATTAGTKKVIGLAPVGGDNKPLNGSCMTAAGSGTPPGCDSCHFAGDQMAFLREATEAAGFNTSDSVHRGPCEIHRRHAYTVGPYGDLYACPGFTGDRSMATGHIDGRIEASGLAAAENFNRLAAWRECKDCAFIPVCAGGCTVAAHTELGDLHRPNCHKTTFEAGVVSMARAAAARLDGQAPHCH